MGCVFDVKNDNFFLLQTSTFITQLRKTMGFAWILS